MCGFVEGLWDDLKPSKRTLLTAQKTLAKIYTNSSKNGGKGLHKN
jgi:hypothetical protein